jgi:hypothetical protein
MDTNDYDENAGRASELPLERRLKLQNLAASIAFLLARNSARPSGQSKTMSDEQQYRAIERNR